MAKAPRKPTPAAIEQQVLDQSRRRCTLCFSTTAKIAAAVDPSFVDAALSGAWK